MLGRLLALDLWMACLRDGVLGRATASSASLVQHAQMARAV
jgi:hypothetical protein